MGGSTVLVPRKYMKGESKAVKNYLKGKHPIDISGEELTRAFDLCQAHALIEETPGVTFFKHKTYATLVVPEAEDEVVQYIIPFYKELDKNPYLAAYYTFIRS